ncbi:MAG: transcription elongation factor GreA [Acidimicrobiia bacterium]
MSKDGTWLTPDAYRKLEEELAHLTNEGRSHIEERIAEARSHGDIRENADYEAAKDEQALLEARIRQVAHLLETAEVREVEDTDRVVVGSLVTVIDGEGNEVEYFVAPTENRVPGYLLASPAGPLGKALLGTAPGDEVTYHAPGGAFTVKVVTVRPYRG